VSGEPWEAECPKGSITYKPGVGVMACVAFRMFRTLGLIGVWGLWVWRVGFRVDAELESFSPQG